MTPEALARVHRIAAALADELVDPQLATVGDRHRHGVLECPGCGAPALKPVRSGDAVSVEQCSECGGAWLGVDELHEITNRAMASAPARPPADRARLRDQVRAMAGPVGDVTYRPCPRCRTVMLRKNFGDVSGVMIDECPDHGVFLDAGELEAFQHFIAHGGLAWSRELEAARRASAQLRQDRTRKLAAAEKVREAFSRATWQQNFWIGLGG